MQIQTFIVDAFTNEPFKGNQAGVCVLAGDIEDGLMLAIAKELGLSETAFVRKTAEHHFSIRYFSPKMEIMLCGHATLASAKVLFARNTTANQIVFTTIRNIPLTVTRSNDEIIMQFPVYETEPATVPTALLDALGLETISNCAYNKELSILLLEIADSRVLRRLAPDFEALLKSHHGINGVLVTSVSGETGFDFESRYFWPWSGTNEDPVTGGTHTFLAGYWGKKMGKTKMNAFQCSERSGYMAVELINEKTLTITSHARIVLTGMMEV